MPRIYTQGTRQVGKRPDAVNLTSTSCTGFPVCVAAITFAFEVSCMGVTAEAGPAGVVASGVGVATVENEVAVDGDVVGTAAVVVVVTEATAAVVDLPAELVLSSSTLATLLRPA